MRIFSIFVMMLLRSVASEAQSYITLSARLQFSDSAASIVSAMNGSVASLINTHTDSVSAMIKNADFLFNDNVTKQRFDVILQPEKKYTGMYFQAKFNQHIDPQKDGVYPFTASGKISANGVGRNTILHGIIKVKRSHLIFSAELSVTTPDTRHFAAQQLAGFKVTVSGEYRESGVNASAVRAIRVNTHSRAEND